MSQEEADKYKADGNRYLKEKYLDKALEAYSKAIEIFPSNAIYYANRAQVELKLEQYGSAIVDSTKAIELDPDYLKAYYRRAVAYSNIFKYKESTKDLQFVLSKKATDTASKMLLKDLIKIERKFAFEKAIRTEDEGNDMFKVENYESLLNKTDQSYVGPKLDFQIIEKEITIDDEVKTIKKVEITNLSEELIWDFIEYFKTSGKNLPKSYLFAILLHISTILQQEPVFKELQQSQDKFTVVGDVHGQFYDLIHYFKDNGIASSTHQYLFNGDFVDRGSWSCEVIITLYLLKILHPTKIHLNRGNHETDDMNKVYGFEDECKHKYSEKIFKMFSQSFKELPLLTLINNDYLVMHGGLFSKPGLTLKELKKKLNKRGNPKDGLEMELLWTDPQPEKGYGVSKRGIGVQFGPDITSDFCELNNLKKIIRSHEVRMDGYSVEHDGKLITIFSAPNYCDSTGNKGAIINIEDGELVFKQYEAQEHPPLRPMAYTNAHGMI